MMAESLKFSSLYKLWMSDAVSKKTFKKVFDEKFRMDHEGLYQRLNKRLLRFFISYI